jgi:hypothetical protein
LTRKEKKKEAELDKTKKQIEGIDVKLGKVEEKLDAPLDTGILTKLWNEQKLLGYKGCEEDFEKKFITTGTSSWNSKRYSLQRRMVFLCIWTNLRDLSKNPKNNEQKETVAF